MNVKILIAVALLASLDAVIDPLHGLQVGLGQLVPEHS